MVSYSECDVCKAGGYYSLSLLSYCAWGEDAETVVTKPEEGLEKMNARHQTRGK